MLSRWLCFSVIAAFTACASGSGARPESIEPGMQMADKKEQTDSAVLLRPLTYIIDQHRTVGTHMDGPRCPMYPSCAHYGHQVIESHGFLGVLLLIDRLFFREFGDLDDRYLPAPRHRSAALRYYDPPASGHPLFSEGRPSFLEEDFSE